MKNTLLLGAMMFFGTVAFGQLKVVSPNGYVKIGDTGVAPTEQLDVDGNAKVKGRFLFVGEDAGSQGAFVEVGLGRSAPGNAGVRFFTNTGNSSGFNFVRIGNANGNGLSRLRHLGTNNFEITTVDAGAELVLSTENTPRLTIRTDGVVDISGPASVNGGISVTSDKRLKSDVNNFKKGLKYVLQLNPVSFNYNGEANTYKGRKFVGLLAQDLSAVVPEFVSPYTYQEKNEKGEVLKSEEYLQIHDSEIKYLLVNAIKEQQRLIEEQSDRINELEAKINKIASLDQPINIENQLQIIDFQEGEANGPKLSPNEPNPFKDITEIKYFVPNSAKSAKMDIYDNSGILVKSVSIQNFGEGTIQLNAFNLTSGYYSYALYVNESLVKSHKMIISK